MSSEIRNFRKKGKTNPLIKFYKTPLIYKIEVNNKIYIGQTTNLNSRLKSYLSNKKDQLIQKAILKHYDFIFSIIEICDKDVLNDKEKYWINYYNSNDLSKGYNLTSGGNSFIMNKEIVMKMKNSAKNKKIVSLYDLEGNLIKTFESIRECARFNNVTTGTISNAIKTNNVLLKKYIVCFGDQLIIEKYKGKNTKLISKAMQGNKHCLKYKWKAVNNNNEYFADSVRELSLKLNIKEQALRSIAYGRNKSSNIIVTKEKI